MAAHCYLPSATGLLCIASNGVAVSGIRFMEEGESRQPEMPDDLCEMAVQQLLEYFAGVRTVFTLPVSQPGTVFRQKVWEALCHIPFGKTISYLTLARQLGDEKAIRAVASANGSNSIAIVVPCHRVIGSNGTLVGYAGGLWRKKWLLEHERKISGTAVQQSLF